MEVLLKLTDDQSTCILITGSPFVTTIDRGYCLQDFIPKIWRLLIRGVYLLRFKIQRPISPFYTIDCND